MTVVEAFAVSYIPETAYVADGAVNLTAKS